MKERKMERTKKERMQKTKTERCEMDMDWVVVDVSVILYVWICVWDRVSSFEFQCCMNIQGKLNIKGLGYDIADYVYLSK